MLNIPSDDKDEYGELQKCGMGKNN